ncbi:MAG: type II toxin-antitoxin system RelB/DinJ family antitoxin [Patescibacteria group bacterium]
MNITTINFKTDANVKNEAYKTAKEMGVNLSVVLNGLLRQFIRTKTVVLTANEEPSEYLIKALNESREDIKRGRVSPIFDNIEDEIAWLNNPKRKYVNQIRKKV